jgi:long-chain acyl-CoA synthetase
VTVAELPFDGAKRYGDKAALRFQRDGRWQDKSYAELAETVRALARGFAGAGLEPGDRVCILAETRPEWTLAELGVLAAGGVVVPIYPSSSAEECLWVAGDSGARMVICEDAAQRTKVAQVLTGLPELTTLLVIDPDGETLTLAQVEAAGRSSAADIDSRLTALQPEDVALIIYTSGTTGPPKGCVLTHRNWLTLCAITEELSYIRAEDVVYLFLPLAHVFAQIVQFGCLYSGGTLVYFGGDPRKVVTELAQAQPTFLPSVPRVFEKVYTMVAGAVPPDFLAQAVRAGLTVRRSRDAGEDVPAETLAVFEAAEPLFAKVRAAFGGRLRLALSGAAPISVSVLEFFHAAGVAVVEGYGMTETTGIGTVSTLARHRLGRVGVASPGTEVRLAEDGEVLMRGPHVFAGYWQNPEATAETIVDGWLHTGDLGELDGEGFLAITGRKKDIIITSGGKNIAPANIENELRQSRWISQAIMYGDNRPYPVALISLDPDEVIPWARERGLAEDMPTLAADPQVRELVQGVLETANARYSRAQQVKRFAILGRDLNQEAGELTPTMKVKRKIVHANHAAVLEALYEDL